MKKIKCWRDAVIIYKKKKWTDKKSYLSKKKKTRVIYRVNRKVNYINSN